MANTSEIGDTLFGSGLGNKYSELKSGIKKAIVDKEVADSVPFNPGKKHNRLR